MSNGAVVCNLAAWFNMPDEPYRPYYGRRKRAMPDRPNRPKRYSTITVSAISAVRPKAMLVTFEGRDIWVPRSVIFEGPELGKITEETEINVEEWFAKKEGLR